MTQPMGLHYYMAFRVEEYPILFCDLFDLIFPDSILPQS